MSATRLARWLSLVVVAFLCGEVAYHFWGVLQDSEAALGYRYRLDYGEGIVWQQALLMFGPQMYSPSQELPFIVFHYPPLYHFVVRALLLLQLDPLFAGRIVSASSTVACACCTTALVLNGVKGRPTSLQWVLALVFGLLFLCLNPVRTWGIWMRVDMLAAALGLGATLVAARSHFGILSTTVALLLCVASVFTKQTYLAAGLSIFVVGMVCAPRNTLIAASIAGAIGLGCAALLEATTHGFIKNIVSYNINPINWAGARNVLWLERDNAPYVAAMCLAALLSTLRSATRHGVARLRRGDPRSVTESLLTLHFWLACVSVLQIIKEGASSNYFLDFLATGCALLGLLFCDIAYKPIRLAVFTLVLALTTANIQYRRYFADRFAIWTAENDRLVQRVQRSPKPVASDDMTIVLRAGKSVVFEPAIVRVLIASGTWDPSPLLRMVHDHAFAMVITGSHAVEGGPVIQRAMTADYPIVEQATSALAVHLPANPDQP